ncbi:RAMP superfamily CRISPR-associated protein [Sulfolobus acidocaldarius]|uniref:Conserved protein n=3 Tax=Sulfolobus acidocaldarius TaxID=2285 RepID=Q4J793_SULAC|nr:RAMP superfamily CRISPR-associated protein [Sulfolobus acidocaldarius]AAY81339.1 conserved protein [Sulfolobus acidocaldarius DSM 639]AGE74253.1 CRISPR system related protein, RAMP superfamily [Sulfolobus acidocaldarius Ron12/I]ALU29861.1 hypothetical protein ATY89_07860 [Sulfolobus acidocaldarius]ALU32601.1 hypothetical protein ATZ20_10880 [Sulfolobus acidocaldarius]WCM35841.1 hypothetical protein GO597_11130 [Sulfolobus acidocaldarius DSM 639]
MITLYKLVFKTPNGLRVGGEDTLKPLKYDNDYVIPSTSLKGIFRRVSEMIVNDKDHMEEHPVEDLSRYQNELKQIESCLNSNCFDMRFKKILKSKGLEDSNDRKEMVRLYLLWNCPVERLYGSEYFASALTISDSVIRQADIVERTHVVIDRKNKKNLEGHLFTEEILNVYKIDVNVVLRDSSQGNSKQAGQSELWLKTLKFMVNVGTFVGGGKSRGIGLMVLDQKESQFAEIKDIYDQPKFAPLQDKLTQVK